MAKRKGMAIDRRADEPVKEELSVPKQFVNCFRHGQREVITGNTKTGVLDCGHLVVFPSIVLEPPYRHPAVSMS
jgi:hypothetical protein